jgi:putative FmdB family regulatory protein
MPIYSFICEQCGHNQDHLLKIGGVVESCPKCASKSYAKQVTAPSGFAFKGGGFYETDFKSPKKETKT